MRFTSTVGLILGLLFVEVFGGCTQSGQILSEIDETGGGGTSIDPEGTGGAGGAGPMGSGGGGGAVVPGPTGAALRVEGGDLHTCGIVDGALYCWGDNQTGALGLGDFEARTAATRVSSETGWTDVGAGNGLSCGIRAGVVWCWGRGASGQLGAGQFSSSAVPMEVMLPGAAVSLGVGHDHACAILEDQSLHCWGQNTEGQLGQGDPWGGPGVNAASPVVVAPGTTWRKIAAGQGHTCGIQSVGSLWCWGRNTRSELGQGSAQADQTRVPGMVGSDTDWSHITAGQNHTCGIRGGELYCWGDNSHAQLGVTVGDLADVPTLVSGVVGAQDVSVDTFHTCAIDSGSELYCWGRNIEGQLGDGTIEAKETPTLVSPAGAWDQVTVARFHSCGVRQGAILCTGDNASGRLGTGDLQRRSVFSPTSQF